MRPFDNRPMQWDLYCRVVDNFCDVGVAWRLAADLAGRGESVRLAVDDASALAWLAPHGAPRVEVVAWDAGPSAAPDVVVELFGVGRPRAAWPAGSHVPVLINVEHLTAERYAERAHALPSPSSRPGEPPVTMWFHFPGFSSESGGLLREPGLIDERRAIAERAPSDAPSSSAIATTRSTRCSMSLRHRRRCCWRPQGWRSSR